MAPELGGGCVLLDLDGVLVDSRAAIAGCINHALVEHELPARQPQDLHRFIGPSLATAFAELTAQPPDSALVASCIGSYRDRYARVSVRETVVVPGVEPALAELGLRHRLAIATSKPRALAEPLLRALGLLPFFTALAGPDLSVQGQSKADTIAAAMRALGNPRRAVMVGDRSHDVVGARAHGLPAVGVTWGIGSAEELEGAGAACLVETPSQLPASVRRLLQR